MKITLTVKSENLLITDSREGSSVNILLTDLCWSLRAKVAQACGFTPPSLTAMPIHSETCAICDKFKFALNIGFTTGSKVFLCEMCANVVYYHFLEDKFSHSTFQEYINGRKALWRNVVLSSKVSKKHATTQRHSSQRRPVLIKKPKTFMTFS